jgi:hypothetical protein
MWNCLLLIVIHAGSVPMGAYLILQVSLVSIPWGIVLKQYLCYTVCLFMPSRCVASQYPITDPTSDLWVLFAC